MFSKTQNEPGQKTGAFAEIVGAPAPTIISVDMRVSGDLRTDGDVQIDGVVDGDIQSSTISIGKTAEVNGEVIADKVKVFGRVNGRIRGKEVSLMETAEVNGDIVHESLEINRGAFIDGIVKRSVNEDPKPLKVDLVVGAKTEAKADTKADVKVDAKADTDKKVEDGKATELKAVFKSDGDKVDADKADADKDDLGDAPKKATGKGGQ